MMRLESLDILFLCDFVSLLSIIVCSFFFFFSSRRRHTRSDRDWSSDVCSSDLPELGRELPACIGAIAEGEHVSSFGQARRAFKRLLRCPPCGFWLFCSRPDRKSVV